MRMKNDIFIDMEYYDFVVESRDENSGGPGKHFRWNLRCKCGNLINVRSQCIRQKVKFKCTCYKYIENLIGYKNGKIEVIGFAGYDKRYGRNKKSWFYICDCGLIKISTEEVLVRRDIFCCGNKGCKPKGIENKKYKPDSIYRNTRRDGRRTAWSRRIFERDNFKCICCGSGGKIEAHHLNGWNWCEEGRFDINNGVTLCDRKLSGCHYLFHKKYGNGDNTKKQFIEFLSRYGKTLDIVQLSDTNIIYENERNK